MREVWVEITATRGSAPRDAGTVMKVTMDGIAGTIGGGALEFAAIQKARNMLVGDEIEFREALPLGPNLGQCCGGSVELKYSSVAPPHRCVELDQFIIHEPNPHQTDPIHLWLWGAGHVGRAVVARAHPQKFRITWVDTELSRFPERIPDHARAIPAADMPRLATHADKQANHLIFSYSHDIDLALCAALVKRGVRSCGLIGSATKWTRFQKRLRAMGFDPSPITCPIGDKSLGKAPYQIAQGVVAALLSQHEPEAAL